MTLGLKNKQPLVVPPAALRRAGFKSGQELEIKAAGGVISIVPKLPDADQEYTPEQRRIVDAQLADGLADIKAGRVRGPFSGHEEFTAFAPQGSQEVRPQTKTQALGRLIELVRSVRFERSYAKAPKRVQRAFDKQSNLLIQNLHHPSLRAKSTTKPTIFGRRASPKTGVSIF
jgi:hypothetical protein